MPDSCFGAVMGVFTGRTGQQDIAGRFEPTAYAGHRRSERVALTAGGLAGNDLATGRRLGRENHAVYLFSQDHYAHFEAHLGRPIAPGGFAENLLYEGLGEDTFRIGDLLALGTAQIEVTTPRVPCYKLAHFLNTDAGFPSVFSASGRTGFYGRVVKDGEVWAGAQIVRLHSDPANATLREVNTALSDAAPEPSVVARVLASPALFPAAREVVQSRLETLRLGGAAGPRPARVLRRWPVTSQTSVIEIALEGSSEAYPAPGQFITLGVADGRGGRHYRCYSLIDGPSPADPGRCYKIAVRRDSASRSDFSVSQALNGAPLEDMDCKAFLPAGDFLLPDSGAEAVNFIAGGIGITPILWQIETLLAQGGGVEIHLSYLCGRLAEAAFDDRLSDLSARFANFSYALYLTREDGAAAEGSRSILAGRPDLFSLVAGFEVQSEVYVCGPLSMIQAVRDAQGALGRENAKLHFEMFDATAALDSGKSPIGEASLQVASHGISGVWKTGSGYLLDWIEATTPLRPAAACRSGLCRTCLATLDKGAVIYPESVRPPSTSSVLLCCALPASPEVVVSLPGDTETTDQFRI